MMMVEDMAPNWTVLHRRDDGSYVIDLNGMPYHVIESDPLFAAVDAAAEGMTFAPEPAPEAPTLSGNPIDIERDRRFGLGAPIDLGDGRTFVADIDNTSKINIMGLLMAGAPADFRDKANVTHALSAADVASLAQQAMARVSAIYATSWALKALDPIPADYADDARWPA